MSRRLSGYRLPWTGDGYDRWLQGLVGTAGAYVMRDRASGRVLYVGEAHNESGGLYDAITRHFQAWSGPTAGVKLDRSRVEVAYVATHPDDAVAAQDALIRRLKPSKNTLGLPAKPAPGVRRGAGGERAQGSARRRSKGGGWLAALGLDDAPF